MTRLKTILATTVFAASLSAGSACAQHIEKFAAGEPNPKLAAQNVDVSVESTLADKIQANFKGKTFENTYADGYSSGVIMTVRAAYAQSLFEPMWTREGTKSLQKARKAMVENGLSDDLMSEAALNDLIADRFAGSKKSRAEADLELTMTWLDWAGRLSNGLQDDGEAVAASQTSPAQSELIMELQKAGEGDAKKTLQNYEPQHPQYQGLKRALERYSGLSENGGWRAIPSEETIEAGDQDARIPALRRRLIAEGYVSTPDFTQLGAFLTPVAQNGEAATQDEANLAELRSELQSWAMTYDESLEKAVKRFQLAHGLKDDGVVGPKTFAALNESAASKAARIRTSMEKWRAMDNIDGRYIWANIPSFRAEGWNGAERQITMKTVVGMRSRQTPVFSDEIEYAVTNPRWYAPVSIVRKDKLPKLANDPSYAERKGFRIYDRDTGERVSATNVNWNDPSAASEYQLVQGSGASNALGKLKIIFPNKHSVYLHGTPTKYLFDRASRAFSSGCIRLEKPIEMASWLASGDTVVTEEEVRSSVASGVRKQLDFGQTVPVHLTYITVTIGEDGRPEFWSDVYDREPEMAQETRIAKIVEPGAFDDIKAPTTPDEDRFAKAVTEIQPQRVG